MKIKSVIALVAVAVAVVLVLVWAVGVDRSADEASPDEAASRRIEDAAPAPVEHEPSEEDDETAEAAEDAEAEEVEEAEEEPQTEEEKREAEEEMKVNAFDDLTDKWQEPAKKGVTMADVDNFAKQFRQVPKARQDECVHRALNLIPDENVMLLAGILMDKSVDKEIVEEVFNDVLNRDEDVKKPILREVFKDKNHPCWSDAAWILDVTGELP